MKRLNPARLNVFLCALACVLALSCALPAQPDRLELFYSATVRAEDAQRIHFELEVRNPAADTLTFEIPFWAPGAYRPLTDNSYGGRPAIEAMDGFRATDESGSELTLTREGARRFLIQRGKARTVRFHYVNAQPGNRPNNRSYLTSTAGLLDGPRSWAWLQGAQHLPVFVHFELPPQWQAACGLERTPDPFTFHADDYDRLIDAPVALGLMERWTQRVRGVPHEIVALTGGRESSTDVPALQTMVQRIVETSADIFGDLPYPHYTFIYTPGGGGLEHLSSTSIGTANPARITVNGVRGVTAHEYFHTFNVKRMRPAALGPFDYSAPVPVDDLWICEGLTSYFGNIVLWRSGIYSDAEFASAYRSALSNYESNPAHLEQSPQQSSRAVWEDNSRISYYLQGETLGLALDLLIREGSDNRCGLDQAMRRMYREYGGYYRHGAPQPGFASADFPRVIREVSGVNVDRFFAEHIRGAREVDWNRYLGFAGIRAGMQEQERSGFAVLRRWPAEEEAEALLFAPGSPLAAAGLKTGDRILSVNAQETGAPRDALRQLSQAAAGAPLTVAVQRGGAQQTLQFAVPTAGDLSTLTWKQRNGAVTLVEVPHRNGLRDVLAAQDVLLSVGAHSVQSVAHAGLLLSAIEPGRSVELRLRRAGSEKTVTCKAGSASARRVQSFDFMADASARQLLIREGLKTGRTAEKR